MGDSLPDSLAAYYAGLDAGRFDEAADCFSDDAVYAVPFAGAHEVDPRNVVAGRSDLASYFASRGAQSYRHRILFCASDGVPCLVEGVSEEAATGRALRTFVASLQLDEQGLVSRYLAYQCEPAVTRGAAEVGMQPVDAAILVDRYFDALCQGRFEEAARCFSQDVLYSHPPYRHSGIADNRRLEVKGREALLETFRRRGQTSYGYRVDVLLQRGPNAIFENAVTDLPVGGEGGAVASLSLDSNGLIYRYVAFYCEPAVPRRSATWPAAEPISSPREVLGMASKAARRASSFTVEKRRSIASCR